MTIDTIEAGEVVRAQASAQSFVAALHYHAKHGDAYDWLATMLNDADVEPFAQYALIDLLVHVAMNAKYVDVGGTDRELEITKAFVRIIGDYTGH